MGFLERGAAGPLLKGGRDGEEGLDWETAGMGLETAVLKGFVLGVRLMVGGEASGSSQLRQDVPPT